jgi:hypothetical protein
MRKIWAICGAVLFLLGELEDYFERQVIEESSKHLIDWISNAPEGNPHDPATLSTGHRSFLEALLKDLLLTDLNFVSRLRELLTSSNDIVAQTLRLQEAQRNIDLEDDEGVIDALTNNTKDLADTKTELDRARKRTDSACKDLIDRLRKASEEGIESRMGASASSAAFTPYREVRLERLLMKLDFSRGGDGLGMNGTVDSD